MIPATRVFPMHEGIRCLRCHTWIPRPREQPSGAITAPRPGDFWLCRSCGELHRFGDFAIVGGLPSLGLRLAELGELVDMGEEDRADLLAIRDRIRGAPN